MIFLGVLFLPFIDTIPNGNNVFFPDFDEKIPNLINLKTKEKKLNVSFLKVCNKLFTCSHLS